MDLLQELGLEAAGLGTGILFGALGWFVVRYVVTGFFTVDQNERAVKTRFGRAERSPGAHDEAGSHQRGTARTDEDRYDYPQLGSSPPAAPTSSGPGRRSTRSRSPPRR